MLIMKFIDRLPAGERQGYELEKHDESFNFISRLSL
jgi:hypothetical protein